MANDTNHILNQLSTIVGEEHILTDQDSKCFYGRDWTTFYQPNPLAIVFPQSTEQVQAIVKLANEQQQAIVPSAGRTGYSGGAVACHGEIVVSSCKMNKIIDFDQSNHLVTCQPGVITQQLQEFAEQQGLIYPVNFASAGSSQIGGNIGTNAGGVKVIRYGSTRRWVGGLTVVTGKGDVLDLNHGLFKNATGYDLLDLFIGSEGTLGMVTEAKMRLTAPPKATQIMLLGLNDLAVCMDILNELQTQTTVCLFEFFTHTALKYVLGCGSCSPHKNPFSQDYQYYLLVEYELFSKDHKDDMLTLLTDFLNKQWIQDAVISQSHEQSRSLLSLREEISASLIKYSPFKSDLAVLPGAIPPFLQDLEKVLTEDFQDYTVVCFGHIGDGNIHVNVLQPPDQNKQQFFDQCDQIIRLLYQLVEQYRGAISAEHGIGLLKKSYLSYSRKPAEIDCMKSIKAAFDPNGIMNPHKLF